VGNRMIKIKKGSASRFLHIQSPASHNSLEARSSRCASRKKDSEHNAKLRGRFLFGGSTGEQGGRAYASYGVTIRRKKKLHFEEVGSVSIAWWESREK